ncbi:hypothetical protein AB0758_30665 [Tolypothrix bouteillei VB521301_2]|uniref:hypothetical protein n=1 Tax=Tolypothrix bouteillei TaxID=1246981 RepID=UPI0038B66CA9
MVAAQKSERQTYIIDDNDVTIADILQISTHFSVAKTLEGHGLSVNEGDGEDLDDLYRRLCAAVTQSGPVALVNKRKMAVGIEGIEGSTHGHDVIPVDKAIAYLEKRGLTGSLKPTTSSRAYPSPSKATHSLESATNGVPTGTYLVKQSFPFSAA